MDQKRVPWPTEKLLAMAAEQGKLKRKPTNQAIDTMAHKKGKTNGDAMSSDTDTPPHEMEQCAATAEVSNHMSDVIDMTGSDVERQTEDAQNLEDERHRRFTLSVRSC